MKFRWETEFKETEIGEIPREWEIENLCWAVKSLESGNRPQGGVLKHDPTGVLSIGGENITWKGDLILDNCLRFSEEFYKSLTRGKIEKEDILLVKDGATIGKLAFIKEIPESKAMVNEHVFLIKTDRQKYNPRYLFYYLFSEIGQSFIESSISGSAQGGINKSILDTVKIPKLNLPEQNRIATVLSYFDDLIENKKRQNEILEKTAMAIFKNWFIDFEPFRDGEFVDSEIGKIPKGWEIGRLREVCKIIMGQSPESKYYNFNGEGLPFIQGVGQFGKITPETDTFCSKILKMAKRNDILITVRAPIAELNFADNEYIIGRGVCALRGHYYSFVYLYLLTYGESLKALERGTTFDAITKDELENFQMVLPPPPILQKFHSLVEPLFQKIILNQKQIMLLRKIRDKLLPLLVFGKLRVEEEI
ncbi:MAG: restriction endonuclease subunit S [candidate division WOR-3 bacterium]